MVSPFSYINLHHDYTHFQRFQVSNDMDFMGVLHLRYCINQVWLFLRDLSLSIESLQCILELDVDLFKWISASLYLLKLLGFVCLLNIVKR